MASLPPELHTRITSHLEPITDTPTLLALALASRPFHTASTSLLYLSLYLVAARPIPLLLRTLLARPALAALPRLMYIHPSNPSAASQYWPHLEALLRTAGRDLEVLCIVSDGAPASASWVLRGMHDAHGTLTSLRVSFWWDSEIAAFLESPGARALTRLDTGGEHGHGHNGQASAPLALNVAAVPHLTVLDAPPAALALLVPGRPVALVHLRAGPLPRARTLLAHCLARSTAARGVTAVDLGDLTYANRAEIYSLEVLEMAGRWMPALEMLGRVNFPWTKDVPTSRMHKALLRLPHLHSLELVITHIQPPVDVYWELATASELRMFSASLRQLVFWRGYEPRRWVWHDFEEDWVVVAPEQDPALGAG